MRHQSQASTFVMRRTHCQIHWILPVPLCPCAPCTLYSQYRLVRPPDTPSHAVIRTRPRHAKEIAALKFKRFDFSSTFSCFSCVFYFWFPFFLLLLFVISVFSTTPSRRCWQKFFRFFSLYWLELKMDRSHSFSPATFSNDITNSNKNLE